MVEKTEAEKSREKEWKMSRKIGYVWRYRENRERFGRNKKKEDI